MRHKISTDHGEPTSVTVFIKGSRPLVAAKEHPNFGVIIEALRAGEDDPKKIRDLFDTSEPIKRGFRKALRRMGEVLGLVEEDVTPARQKLSRKVEVKNGRIYYQGKEIDNSLVDVIVDYHTEGNEDFTPLVLFLENLMKNPNEHSREHLYRWVANRDLAITDDGCFLAYKAVHKLGDKGTHTYRSSTAGANSVRVDGRKFTGHVPQSVGSVVEMPRDEVTFAPGVHCAAGLHAGTWAYTRWFGGSTTLRVKINPADVVSVPTDHGSQKLRVCRYTVVDEVTSEQKGRRYKTPVVAS